MSLTSFLLVQVILTGGKSPIGGCDFRKEQDSAEETNRVLARPVGPTSANRFALNLPVDVDREFPQTASTQLSASMAAVS
jgi:hypothetical protein